MKAVVICGTGWVEMLAHCWGLDKRNQVAKILVPSVGVNFEPGQVAKIVLETVAKFKPDFVLDVNGHALGCLPDSETWLSEAVGVPWVEWWFDDPAIYAAARKADSSYEGYLKALESPNVRHFVWDGVLAREYSKWSGRVWTHLPTATHPGFFHPAAAAHSKINYKPCDIFFAGTYYTFQLPSRKDGNYAAEQRLLHPERDYFELAAAGDAPAEMKGLFPAEGRCLRKAFDDEARAFRHRANVVVGLERRNKLLDSFAGRFKDSFFIGEGWPAEFKAQNLKVYQPAEMARIGAVASLSLDIGNGQGFTGVNMRVYEMMSCGSALACSTRPEFDTDGSLEGEAYLRFSSVEELESHLSRLRSDASLNARLRRSAREYVERNHSWTNRLEILLRTLR